MTELAALEIRESMLDDALSKHYLAYALSTITSRSLPDARDGLKPVHRRLLYAMRELRLNPDSGYKKCARIVGDVMGKYHPHGDLAIYEAMVRLAQTFSVRYPLVDGQGNFGNVDGDNPAAMRYTEARMSAIAQRLLDGIDEDAVDFRETYDGEGREPIVLPANFPNLLGNGASGIAVGMATNIPPHNIGELCDGLRLLLKKPDCTIEELVQIIGGPDFPTGGVICEDQAAIIEAYRTGRGSFRIRARWELEQLKGGGWQIVVTEIPYQVQKSRLIERIHDLINQRKIAYLADARDESAEDLRIVLEPKSRNVEPEHLMESLFKQTDLENRFSLNMNMLLEQGRVPKVASLKQALQAYLDHRLDVLLRRNRFRHGQIERRLEILQGLLVCYLNLDRIIAIIREEDDPKAVMAAEFKLTELQVEAILNMRLRALRKLEEMEIRAEFDRLSAELADIKALLADPKKQQQSLDREIAQLKKDFPAESLLGKRRTTLSGAVTSIDVPIEATIEREAITIICSHKGWIRALKGHLPNDTDVKFKEGDGPRFHLHAHTTDRLLVFATNGRFYTIGADKLPGGRGTGEPIRLMIDLANDDDLVVIFLHRPDRQLLLASSDGRGFVIAEKDVVAQTKNGKQIMNLAQGAEAALCRFVTGDHVAVVGQNRKLLVFPVEQIPEMARGRGVILQKYRDGGIADIKIFTLSEGLSWKIGERSRVETDLTAWLGERAQVGRMPPNGFPKSNRFGEES